YPDIKSNLENTEAPPKNVINLSIRGIGNLSFTVLLFSNP
ncbi:hypothetical protein JL09_g6900, partial [Pichia kudriavzevii]